MVALGQPKADSEITLGKPRVNLGEAWSALTVGPE